MRQDVIFLLGNDSDMLELKWSKETGCNVRLFQTSLVSYMCVGREKKSGIVAGTFLKNLAIILYNINITPMFKKYNIDALI